MRCGCFGLLVTAALLIGGGQSLYTGLKYRQPLEMNAVDYLAKRPDDKWVKLNHCFLDVSGIAFSSTFGVGGAKEVYIPIRASADDAGEVKALLHSTNKAYLDFAEALRSDQKAEIASKDQQIDKLKQIGESLKAMNVKDATVTGLVEFGMDSNDKKRRKLSKLSMNLAKDYLIIKDGEKPSIMQGLVMTALGLVCAIFVFSGSSKQAQAS